MGMARARRTADLAWRSRSLLLISASWLCMAEVPHEGGHAWTASYACLTMALVTIVERIAARPRRRRRPWTADDAVPAKSFPHACPSCRRIVLFSRDEVGAPNLAHASPACSWFARADVSAEEVLARIERPGTAGELEPGPSMVN